MINELNAYEIALIVTLAAVQIRLHTSAASREWVMSRTRNVLAWTLSQGNRFLHAFLMSPVNPRRSATKDTRD